jgi:hypothetical protein
VRISGVRGQAPPERLKVAISYADGHRSVGRILVSGPDTLRKAHKAAEIFWAVAGGSDRYDEASTQFIGWDAAHPPLGTEEPSEVLVQFGVRDADRRTIERHFAPMVVGSMLQSMPGMTMPADQGRPRVADVVGHWPALISRERVLATVTVDGATEVVTSEAAAYSGPQTAAPAGLPEAPVPSEPPAGEPVTVALMRLCLARSGDKGDTANVGVRARSAEIYAWLVDFLTEDVVRQHFKGVCTGDVERHLLPNLLAVNFLLHGSLGGGGTSSLRFDAQGKTFSQFLLSMPVTVPIDLLATGGHAP